MYTNDTAKTGLRFLLETDRKKLTTRILDNLLTTSPRWLLTSSIKLPCALTLLVLHYQFKLTILFKRYFGLPYA